MKMTRKIMAVVLAIAMILSCVSGLSAFAADDHIYVNSETGDDNNVGTVSSAPVKTIKAALDLAKAGNCTIEVLASKDVVTIDTTTSGGESSVYVEKGDTLLVDKGAKVIVKDVTFDLKGTLILANGAVMSTMGNGYFTVSSKTAKVYAGSNYVVGFDSNAAVQIDPTYGSATVQLTYDLPTVAVDVVSYGNIIINKNAQEVAEKGLAVINNKVGSISGADVEINIATNPVYNQAGNVSILGDVTAAASLDEAIAVNLDVAGNVNVKGDVALNDSTSLTVGGKVYVAADATCDLNTANTQALTAAEKLVVATSTSDTVFVDGLGNDNDCYVSVEDAIASLPVNEDGKTYGTVYVVADSKTSAAFANRGTTALTIPENVTLVVAPYKVGSTVYSKGTLFTGAIDLTIEGTVIATSKATVIPSTGLNVTVASTGVVKTPNHEVIGHSDDAIIKTSDTATTTVALVEDNGAIALNATVNGDATVTEDFETAYQRFITTDADGRNYIQKVLSGIDNYLDSAEVKINVDVTGNLTLDADVALGDITQQFNTDKLDTSINLTADSLTVNKTSTIGEKDTVTVGNLTVANGAELTREEAGELSVTGTINDANGTLVNYYADYSAADEALALYAVGNGDGIYTSSSWADFEDAASTVAALKEDNLNYNDQETVDELIGVLNSAYAALVMADVDDVENTTDSYVYLEITSTNGGTVSYTYNNGANEGLSLGYTYQKVNSNQSVAITPVANDGCTFNYYYDVRTSSVRASTGSIDKSATLSITPASNTYIGAAFYVPVTNYKTVTYISAGIDASELHIIGNGTILYSKTVKVNASVTAPTPTMPSHYVLNQWKNVGSGNNYVYLLDFTYVNADQTSITLRNTVNGTIGGRTYTDTVLFTGSYKKAIYTDPTNFSYWAYSDGKVFSTSNELTIATTMNYDLTAVYNGASVAAKPGALSVVSTDFYTPTSGRTSLRVTFSVPSDVTSIKMEYASTTNTASYSTSTTVDALLTACQNGAADTTTYRYYTTNLGASFIPAGTATVSYAGFTAGQATLSAIKLTYVSGGTTYTMVTPVVAGTVVA